MMGFMKIKRLSDDMRIEGLLQTTELTPIISTIKSKVLKLHGHTKRCNQGVRVRKICLERMIEGIASRENNQNDGETARHKSLKKGITF